MSPFQYYNRDGAPITFDDWVRLNRHDPQYYRVALDYLRGTGRTISTVALGLDHQYGEGPPLIFETMVFPSGSWDVLDMARYSTLAEAQAGHAEMVIKWQGQQ